MTTINIFITKQDTAAIQTGNQFIELDSHALDQLQTQVAQAQHTLAKRQDKRRINTRRNLTDADLAATLDAKERQNLSRACRGMATNTNASENELRRLGLIKLNLGKHVPTSRGKRIHTLLKQSERARAQAGKLIRCTPSRQFETLNSPKLGVCPKRYSPQFFVETHRLETLNHDTITNTQNRHTYKWPNRNGATSHEL